MAVLFSVPQYYPADASETVVGYNVQAMTPVAGNSSFTWTNVTGSPFALNTNIFDPTGTNNTYYQVQPFVQTTQSGSVYTLDSPWSKPFLPTQNVYDMMFTRALLPALRFTYLNDAGIQQTNGTALQETTGAGNGLWVFDGKTTRFNLQYVTNDDPIHVLDNTFNMTYIVSGQTTPSARQPEIDYTVDVRAGCVTFKTAPSTGDYCRFDFRRVDFVNEDLLVALTGAFNALSQFGKGGYQTQQSRNLVTLNKPLESPDLGEIACKIAIFLMREGQTESALRSSAAWRDGQSSIDPYPSRALEFLCGKLDITENSLRRAVNSYTRTWTMPKSRGEYQVFWDLTQLTPLVGGMWRGLPGAMYGGSMGAGIGGPFFPWYI